jgi:Protein of unknown function (DUF3592)
MIANPIRRLHEARIRNWPVTQATIDGCSWVSGHDNLGKEAGHYDVSFVYRTDRAQDLHRGSFCYDGCREIAPYRAGEVLPIHYNPKKPARYSLSGASSNYEKIEAIVVMALFGLIAGYVLITF